MHLRPSWERREGLSLAGFHRCRSKRHLVLGQAERQVIGTTRSYRKRLYVIPLKDKRPNPEVQKIPLNFRVVLL
jgi:hypothetical protein